MISIPKPGILLVFYLLIMLSSCQQFDSVKADTKNNKNRFNEYVEVELTADVKDIYAYGDLGKDYSVRFSFKCNPSTVKRIIEMKHLKLAPQYDEGLFGEPAYPWWKTEKIAKIKPYRFIKEFELYEYLWYDTKTQTAYYEEFSL